MIKSAKRATYAILGIANVPGEELMTAFTGAEALINSKPLTYQSANPSHETHITPNCFLVGQVGGQSDPGSVDSCQFSPKKRWRQMQDQLRVFGTGGCESGCQYPSSRRNRETSKLMMSSW